MILVPRSRRLIINLNTHSAKARITNRNRTHSFTRTTNKHLHPRTLHNHHHRPRTRRTTNASLLQNRLTSINQGANQSSSTNNNHHNSTPPQLLNHPINNHSRNSKRSRTPNGQRQKATKTIFNRKRSTNSANNTQ